MARPSKFVTSYTQCHRLTHFLAIPLVTPASRSRVGDSFKCLWDDLAAIGVPINAIRSPGLLHLNLDILLRLDTPERMARATEILKKVSIREALSKIHGTSTSDNLFKHPSIALPQSIKDTDHSIAPPTVSISGLSCTPGMEARAFNLHAVSYDATHSVRNLKLQLAHAYQAAGLSPTPRRPRDTQVQAATEEILGSYDAIVCLLRIPRSNKIVPSERFPGKLRSVWLPLLMPAAFWSDIKIICGWRTFR